MTQVPITHSGPYQEFFQTMLFVGMRWSKATMHQGWINASPFRKRCTLNFSLTLLECSHVILSKLEVGPALPPITHKEWFPPNDPNAYWTPHIRKQQIAFWLNYCAANHPQYTVRNAFVVMLIRLHLLKFLAMEDDPTATADIDQFMIKIRSDEYETMFKE